MSKKRPVVMRAFAPDEEAKAAALKLLIEHAPLGRASVNGSEASGTDEKYPTPSD